MQHLIHTRYEQLDEHTSTHSTRARTNAQTHTRACTRTHTPNSLQVMRRIVDERWPVKYPPYMTPAAKDLIQRLLERKPAKRIGMLQGRAADIKNHKWFEVRGARGRGGSRRTPAGDRAAAGSARHLALHATCLHLCAHACVRIYTYVPAHTWPAHSHASLPPGVPLRSPSAGL